MWLIPIEKFLRYNLKPYSSYEEKNLFVPEPQFTLRHLVLKFSLGEIRTKVSTTRDIGTRYINWAYPFSFSQDFVKGGSVLLKCYELSRNPRYF